MMIVRALWREAARFPAACARSTITLLLISITHIAQAVAVAWAMSAMFSGSPGETAAALASILGIATLRLALSLAQSSAASRLGGMVRARIRARALRAALSSRRIHDPATRDGAIRATVSDGIDGTDTYVAQYIPAVTQVAIMCPLVITAVVFIHPRAGVALAFAVVVALVGPMAWKRMMARRGLEHWDSYEALSADLLAALRGMATLRTIGDVPGTRQQLHARSAALRAATERVMRASLAETGVIDFAIQAGTVAAAATAIVRAATGEPPALETYLVLLLAAEAFRPIRDLSRHWHAGYLGLTALPGLTDIGAFTPEGEESRHGASFPGSRTTRVERLVVSDVWFRYPDSDRAVLRGLDLHAQPGALTAIVGASGAGKSTLFDVLLGFLPPTAGRVTLNGRPLRGDDVAVVSQRPVLFAGTIRENLSPGTSTTDAALERACAAAGILDEIQRLPEGLNTRVAEAGTSLSGGQRQRLALARALVTSRPVLLVDEPTSALDDARAHDVMATLHQVARERIVIMISHRLETLADVAHPLHLEDGRLDEVRP